MVLQCFVQGKAALKHLARLSPNTQLIAKQPVLRTADICHQLTKTHLSLLHTTYYNAPVPLLAKTENCGSIAAVYGGGTMNIGKRRSELSILQEILSTLEGEPGRPAKLRTLNLSHTQLTHTYLPFLERTGCIRITRHSPRIQVIRRTPKGIRILGKIGDLIDDFESTAE